MKVYTSVNPGMVRSVAGQDVSVEYQRQCVQSWLQAGFEVVSINNEAEALAVSTILPEVSIVTITDPRPRIKQFLSLIEEGEESSAGIINSDCVLSYDNTAFRHIENISAQGMLLLERLSFEAETLQARWECCGFDGFFFPKSVLVNLKIDEAIRIGDSWWDDIFPLCFLEAGGRLFRAESPCLLHLDHPIAWDEANYVAGGKLSRDMFGGKFGLSNPKSDDYETLACFSQEAFKRIEKLAQPVCLGGEDVTALMKDRIAGGIRRHAETRGPSSEEVVRMAILEQKLSHPSNRAFGEFLCTLSKLFRWFDADAANGLAHIGENLQFRSYYRPEHDDRS